MIPFPDKKYQIIYADPPWSYSDTQKAGGTAYFGASVRYDTMNNGDIARLPVESLAERNCVLFLWATSPLLPEALKAIESWGFKYKTIAFCWNKQSKHGKWVSNMGRWTMGNIEICLLGVKGKPRRITKNIKQLVIAERKKTQPKTARSGEKDSCVDGRLASYRVIRPPENTRLGCMGQ